MKDYLVVGDELLLDDLHGVDAPGAAQFDHEDFGVRAAADDADQLEVGQRVRPLHRRALHAFLCRRGRAPKRPHRSTTTKKENKTMFS